MTVEGESIRLDDDHDDGSAFVFLSLYEGDIGSSVGRSQRPEFLNREPWCIPRQHFDQYGCSLIISNTGQLISDVVTLEYEIVFCTYEGHNAQDGFTSSHASENQSDQLDKFLSMDVIEPMSTRSIQIEFPDLGFDWVRNVYFRARVSTLWEPSVPMDQWDFATDIHVTEAHYRVPQ